MVPRKKADGMVVDDRIQRKKGVTTCYTLDSVILRPVMSMKLSQPGCVGSIEGISSIGSLHLIALFSHYFFNRLP